MSTILLTGGTGFLGSKMANALVEYGYHVVVLKRASSDLHCLSRVAKSIAFYDVEGLDLSEVFKKEGQIEAVIHTATTYGRSGESNSEIMEVNNVFPSRLLKSAIASNVKTFINIDTAVPPNINTYALSKRQFSELGRQHGCGNEIQFINVRLEHIYGPDDRPYKFTTWLMQNCLKNVPVIPLTTGKQSRDFIYIKDAVSGLIEILTQGSRIGPGFQEIELGSGDVILIKDLAEKVQLLTQSKSQLSFGAVPYRENEPMYSQANLTRMNQLGWKPLFGLDRGLEEMVKLEMRREEDKIR